MGHSATSPFIECVDEHALVVLAAYWQIEVKTLSAAKIQLAALFEDNTSYERWLSRMGPLLADRLTSLAFGPDTFTEIELDRNLSTFSESQVRCAELKSELRTHCILYERRHSLPPKLLLHPGLRERIIARHLHLPHRVAEDLPSLNPTFHPVVPLRLFLAALAGESYRVLSDDSFFFKPSTKKLLAKFSLAPSPASLRFLFRFCLHLDLLKTKHSHAELALDTLYHLNFHEATFLYFAYVFLSPLYVFFSALKQGSPQQWFEESATDALLAKCLALTLSFKSSPRAPSWHPQGDAGDLHTNDLVALGYLVRKSFHGKPYVQINPWYFEWLFDHVPPLKRTRMSDFGQRFIVQPNYEILMPPDLAWPSFLQLISLAKAERCDLVCHLKLSKASVKAGMKLGVEADQVLSFFANHAWSLPSNVRQSLEDWGKAATHKPSANHANHSDEGPRLEDLRKEVNRLLALPLSECLASTDRKSKNSYSVWREKEEVLAPAYSEPVSVSVPPVLATVAPARTDTYRKHLFLLEEYIRNKITCQILHAAREGRRKWREIRPLRIHRDDASIYIEAECPDLDIIRSFKLDHIIEIKKV